MKKKLIMRVRFSSFVRSMFKPYKDWQKKRWHEQYLLSSDSQYLKTLRGIHHGKRCFIIGNGPSLRAEDLEKLKGEYTFSSNRIYNIFPQTKWRPTYYVAMDPTFIKNNYLELLHQELGHMFIACHRGAVIKEPVCRVTQIFCDHLVFDVNLKIWNDGSTYISEDVSSHVCDGYTVTFCAIQLAIYMGFKEIFLLGIDNNYSIALDESGKEVCDKDVADYFDHKKYADSNYFLPTSFAYSYAAAREYCDNHNICIRNATRGGRLEAFERVDFDSLF